MRCHWSQKELRNPSSTSDIGTGTDRTISWRYSRIHEPEELVGRSYRNHNLPSKAMPDGHWLCSLLLSAVHCRRRKASILMVDDHIPAGGAKLDYSFTTLPINGMQTLRLKALPIPVPQNTPNLCSNDALGNAGGNLKRGISLKMSMLQSVQVNDSSFC